ncbi:MAG: hypothetical protein J6W84_03445 [Bacteroidales bacterium]|nr:hypothetical protein [Bacteroidales bacterium]
MGMTLTGELIQMNAHMEMSAGASVLVVIGAIMVVGFSISAIVYYGDCGWKFSVVLFILAAVGISLMVVGFNKPKEQIIHACANGPISLEQVAVKYDIISVDGKELTLRVR